MTGNEHIKLVFMLEEKSAKHFLDALLPGLLPKAVKFRCIPHEGKSDLQRSIPIKLKAWRNTPGIKTVFIILHDQDNHDCIALKNRLRQLCAPSNRHPLICIVCRELEAWYFGDLDAVQKVFPQFSANRYKNKAKFRNPDAITKPGKELEKIIPSFSKPHAAKEIPKHMDIRNNTSASFHHTISGIRKLTGCLAS